MRLLSRLRTLLDSPKTTAPSEPALADSSAPPPANARRRALTPIGHPDVLPPPAAFLNQAHRDETTANANGAIAAIWHSSQCYRPYGGTDHAERDQKIYTVRGNWALGKGLMRAGPEGFTDEITGPCEESGCQCNYQFVFHLRDIPKDMLTELGVRELARAQQRVSEMMGGKQHD